jgi:hypothetical protein
LAVVFQKNRRGYVCGFEVRGHAHFGTPGQDIVCAGVSALSQAALLGLEEFADQFVTSEVRPGFLRVSVREPLGWDELPRVYGIIRMLELGFAAIERSYPGWLRVTYEEVTK